MTEQRTSPEMRAVVRERARRRDEKGWEYVAVEVGVLAALYDDAEALAGARVEIGRLRAALAFVLDEMEGCEGRQGMWEDGIDPDYRRAIEHGRAALGPEREGAGDALA